MASKKDFKTLTNDFDNKINTAGINYTAEIKNLDSLKFEYMREDGKQGRLDFSEFSQSRTSSLAKLLLYSLAYAITYQTKSMATIIAHAEACIYFCRFSLTHLNKGDPKYINHDFIQKFINSEKNRQITNPSLSRDSLRTKYKAIKSVLTDLISKNLISADEDIFPFNPFNGLKSQTRNIVAPLTRDEKISVQRCLRVETSMILEDKSIRTPKMQLSILLISILFKTGANLAPILSLVRDEEDVFIDHPLENYKIMKTFKKRSMKINTTPLIQPFKVKLDVLKIFTKCVSITALAAQSAKHLNLKDKLFVYIDKNSGQVFRITQRDVTYACNFLSKKYNLTREDGSLLLGSKMFRNTYAHELNEATNGDIAIVSELLGNTIKVADGYIKPNQEDYRVHNSALKELIELYSNDKNSKLAKTPIASCKDIFNGDKSPKDGSICTRFGVCFSCSSFLIVEEDLYKFFSFYWRIYYERQKISTRAWSKKFSWIIRAIDNDIVPLLKNPKKAQAKKERARISPHPMWSRESIL